MNAGKASNDQSALTATLVKLDDEEEPAPPGTSLTPRLEVNSRKRRSLHQIENCHIAQQSKKPHLDPDVQNSQSWEVIQAQSINVGHNSYPMAFVGPFTAPNYFYSGPGTGLTTNIPMLNNYTWPNSAGFVTYFPEQGR